MNWSRKEIDLGVVKPKQKQRVIFKAVVPLNVKTITSSCGCTSPKYNEEKNTIEVIYTPGNIPYHLKSKGEQLVRKTITVYYEDGSREVLAIKAIIKG